MSALEDWFRLPTEKRDAFRAELKRKAIDAYHAGTHLIGRSVDVAGRVVDRTLDAAGDAIDQGVDKFKVEYDNQVAKAQRRPSGQAAPRPAPNRMSLPQANPSGRAATQASSPTSGQEGGLIEKAIIPIVNGGVDFGKYLLKAGPYVAKNLPEEVGRNYIRSMTDPLLGATEYLLNAQGHVRADGKPLALPRPDELLFPKAPESAAIYDSEGRYKAVGRKEFLAELSPDQIATLNAGVARGSGRTLDQVLSHPRSHMDMVDTPAPRGWTVEDVRREQALMPAPTYVRNSPARTGDSADLTPGPLGWFGGKPLSWFGGKPGAIENYVDPRTGSVANVTRDSHMFDGSPDRVGVVGNFAVELPDGRVVSRSVSVGDGASGLVNEVIGPYVFRGRDKQMFSQPSRR